MVNHLKLEQKPRIKTVVLHVHGKREHEHLLHPAPPQYPGALIGGSPCSKDVVDQHNSMGELSHSPAELYGSADVLKTSPIL